MLDDVAEKARRNLMVVAGGILAVWALGIPLDGKLVGAVDLSAVEPWRAWAAVTCVLMYFAARYYLAPSTAQEWSAWSRRRRAKLSEQLRKPLENAFEVPASNEHEVQLKWEDCRADFGPNLGLSLPEMVTRRRGTFDYRWIHALDDLMPKAKSRDAALEELGIPVGELRGEYRFNLHFYFMCNLRALRHAYKPSWKLLELSFPWFVAFGAAIVCVYKLAISFYYEFPFVRQLLSA